MTTNIIANRYEILEKLGAGGMGVVWLVRDKLRNQKVALKQVLMHYDDQRLAITREFRTLSTLRHPNIVSVIEYGFHENQPYFTMEFLPDAKSFDLAPDRKIEHFTQVLQALGYLHRRGILHRDLKPGNVMITSDDVVKVLDFGLALDTMRDQSSEISGTVHYMAPELFMGEPASVGSDLWAVGVMICEMEGKRHPFHTDGSISEQIRSIVSNPPDLSGIAGDLASVVSRLLSKNTAERYSSALDLIRDLHGVYKIQLPFESQSHRESFLQAAAFVGREHEYQCLADALNAAAGGTHGLWLIAGEAGVGKSRLLDELRTLALVDGFVVLQGQAVESGGLPYQLWREVARKLVIGVPISDLSARVMKELVPDIAVLIDREVADVAMLEPQANRDRLMAALLERLTAIEAPVLIILEDLHWANESLDLLKLLLPHLDTMPVMIVGSYRNDERPLSEELPEASLLTLARLSPEAIADLGASMVGAENTTPELIERLVKETEGNALFMVEVMRALAEEAGSLQAITRKSLPERILAGGMVAVLQRRVARAPAWALETLKLAAVIGRVIDFPVLKAVGIANIDHWLQVCADAAVLEPYHGEWRFSHDRLREVLLKDSENLPALHEKAALGLEAVYPDDVDYAEALAEHWHIAGNAEREIFFILKAVEHLVNISGDYGRAEKLVQRGLDLNLSHTRTEILLWKGFTAEKQGQYETAIDLYRAGLAADPNPAIKVLLLNRSGHICLRLGNYDEAGDYARQAREVTENPDDQHNSLHLLGIVARYQGDYPAAQAYYEASLHIRRKVGNKKGIADSLNNLGMVAMHQGDNPVARTYFEDSLHIRREMGDRQGTGISLNNLGVIAIYQGDYPAARTYFEDGLQINRKIGDLSGIAGSLNNLGGVAQAQGSHTAARTYFEESLQINRRIGDRQNIAVSMHNIGVLADAQGDFEAARSLYEECLIIAREIGNPEAIIYGTSGLVIVLSKIGEQESARGFLIESLKTAHEMAAIPAMMYALLGAVFWSQNPDQVLAWIGLMLEQGSTDIKDDVRFQALTEKIRSTLGHETVDAAVERGKSLDVRVEIEALLAKLTQALDS